MDDNIYEDNLIERGCCRGNGGTCSKLEVYDWLSDVVNVANAGNVVEVRFKNTRKDYFLNANHLKLKSGDIVAVEANPGHDIGIVSLTGDLVPEQMKKHKVTLINGELRKIYRKAKQADIDKWKEAMQQEHYTMLRSRQIAADLKLNMKIGDVEYQGDKTKAIFYYIADDRVDFRQLIKVLAEAFRIRIEMKQIGARQEAGRIGGVGPCGRELCCASWMSSFNSVSTNAARYQDVSMNPQKLAGQCGKLKCCLNYEVDAYLDAQRDFPPTNIALHTEKGKYVFQKAEIFKGLYWYSPDGEAPLNQIPVSIQRVKEIIRMNQRNRKPDKLVGEKAAAPVSEEKGYKDVIEQESLTRFDKPKDQQRGHNRGRNFKRRKPQQKP